MCCSKCSKKCESLVSRLICNEPDDTNKAKSNKLIDNHTQEKDFSCYQRLSKCSILCWKLMDAAGIVDKLILFEKLFSCIHRSNNWQMKMCMICRKTS